MRVIEVGDLTHHYGSVAALKGVTLDVEEGAFYALLGPNGAGKTTLLRLVSGLLQPQQGQVRVLGEDVRALGAAERTAVTFAGEGTQLPEGLTLGALEAYLAPLYPRWSHSLADALRRRFRLDGARRLRTLSRGEQMKAALLCALAPRPRLLVLDEPFTGMDVLVKDDLVRGVLDVAAAEGCTVLVSSHDLAELELLADTVGFLDAGVLHLSESMESVRDRFRRVELQLPADWREAEAAFPPEWLAVERSGTHLTFISADAATLPAQLASVLPQAIPSEVRGASLREVFVALGRRPISTLEAVEVEG